MCRKETEMLMLEPDVEIELKLSSLFSQLQACIDFLRLKKVV